MVIEHVVDSVNFLKDICRVLRPQGRFLSVSPRITPMPAVSRVVPEMIKKRAVHFLERRDFADIYPTLVRNERTRGNTELLR
jgi:ubiquinone/menaquinone biosynthesis C-methylase UbiE